MDGNLNQCSCRVGSYKKKGLNHPTVFHVRLRLMRIAAYRNRLSVSTVSLPYKRYRLQPNSASV
jgi:hypothetical protein